MSSVHHYISRVTTTVLVVVVAQTPNRLGFEKERIDTSLSKEETFTAYKAHSHIFQCLQI